MAVLPWCELLEPCCGPIRRTCVLYRGPPTSARTLVKYRVPPSDNPGPGAGVSSGSPCGLCSTLARTWWKAGIPEPGPGDLMRAWSAGLTLRVCWVCHSGKELFVNRSRPSFSPVLLVSFIQG